MNEGYTYLEKIDARGAGLSLLGYLTERYTHTSREVWAQRIQKGLVLLDDKIPSGDSILFNGQGLTWMRPPWQEPEVPMHYEVLLLDDDLLAVAKPSGLPTMPAGGFLKNTLLHLVRQDYKGASPIHRLGRGTSGIVLFARRPEVGAKLCASLRDHHMTKIYRALVQGHPREDAFTVDTPIGPIFHETLGTLHAASPEGKTAKSHVRVMERRASCSLVEVHIETGRPHQIRIHMAAWGHPLVGDPLYACGGGLLACVEGEREALPGDEGYLLHAARLSFVHPTTGEAIELICEAPLPLRPTL